MGAEAEKAEPAEAAREGKSAGNAGSVDMAEYKQILLAVAVSMLMIPVIWLCIDYDYHRAPRYIPPPEPTVYEGTIDLDTGHFRITKR